jgi:hypothetical protein
MQIIENFKSLNELAHLIEKLFRSLMAIESQLKLKFINIIKFWSDLTTLIANLGGIHQPFLIKCSNLARELDKKNINKSFLNYTEYINMIL